MDSSPPRARWFWLALVLLSGLHFLLLLGFWTPAITTPDANSYFVQARLLAQDGRTWFSPESTVQYIGPHWKKGPRGRYYCTHPPGFGAVMAPVYKAFGYKAASLVNPVLTSLSLLLLGALFRAWFGGSWGLWAAGVMAMSPFANEHALFGDAHAPVSAALLGGLLLLAHGRRTASSWASDRPVSSTCPSEGHPWF